MPATPGPLHHVVAVRGPVVERSAETVNPELPTGAYEVRVAEAELLSDSATPPFQIEGRGGSEAGEETCRPSR